MNHKKILAGVNVLLALVYVLYCVYKLVNSGNGPFGASPHSSGCGKDPDGGLI